MKLSVSVKTDCHICMCITGEMNFGMYPVDTQVCLLHLASCKFLKRLTAPAVSTVRLA